MESEKNFMRMYPVSGVEEVELLFEKESGLFLVKHSRTCKEPGCHFGLYKAGYCQHHYFLNREAADAEEKRKKREEIKHNPRHTPTAEARKRCRKCQYSGSDKNAQSNGCAYILITGEPRGCSVNDCDKFKPGPRLRCEDKF